MQQDKLSPYTNKETDALGPATKKCNSSLVGLSPNELQENNKATYPCNSGPCQHCEYAATGL